MDHKQDNGCTDSALDQYPKQTIKPGAAHAAADGSWRWKPDKVGEAPELHNRKTGGWESASAETADGGRAQQSGQQPVNSQGSDHHNELLRQHQRFGACLRLERLKRNGALKVNSQRTPRKAMDSEQDIV